MAWEYLTREQVKDLKRRSLKYIARLPPRRRIVRNEPAADPLVSIVIAAYNWSSVLRLALESILFQTEQRFEVLVIGDGCTDDSGEVVQSFGDARLKWHNLPLNTGHQSGPNNEGIARARGRYITYLGQDDIWHPIHLNTMVQAMESAKADVVTSLLEMIGPPGTNFRVITGVYPKGGHDGVRGFPPSGLMHRREVTERIGGWPDYRTVPRNPELELASRMYEAGYTFVSTRELTVFKFNSALRKDSYVEKPCHEQAAYLRALKCNPFFMLREAREIARIHNQQLPMESPAFEPPPSPDTLGWSVKQYRKYRGLE